MNPCDIRRSAIIADDEENLCSHLETLLRKLWPELQLIGIAHSGPEALSLIKQEEPDIAFLDIKMPVMNGINVANHIRGLCHIVFISAYDEFAIQAFEQDAIDYVLKPVNEDRLSKTIRKLKNSLSLREHTQPNWSQLLSRLSASIQNTEHGNYLQWIRAGKADKTILVSVSDIIYFKAKDKYTSVITGNAEYLIRKSIKELVIELNPSHFWQINRGIIVNVSHIVSIKRTLSGSNEVYLKDRNEMLMASRKYSHLFKQM